MTTVCMNINAQRSKDAKHVFSIDVSASTKKVVHSVDIESFDLAVDDIKIPMKLFLCYYRKEKLSTVITARQF